MYVSSIIPMWNEYQYELLILLPCMIAQSISIVLTITNNALIHLLFRAIPIYLGPASDLLIYCGSTACSISKYLLQLSLLQVVKEVAFDSRSIVEIEI
jgi:hypothetical protein